MNNFQTRKLGTRDVCANTCQSSGKGTLIYTEKEIVFASMLAYKLVENEPSFNTYIKEALDLSDNEISFLQFGLTRLLLVENIPSNISISPDSPFDIAPISRFLLEEWHDINPRLSGVNYADLRTKLMKLDKVSVTLLLIYLHYSGLCQTAVTIDFA